MSSRLERKAAARRVNPKSFRALVVRQPWAWAIAAGRKDYENRSWEPGAVGGKPWRGWLLILAGKSTAGEQEAVDRMKMIIPPVFPPVDLPRGVIVCAVPLLDVIKDDIRRPNVWCEPGKKWWKLGTPIVFPDPVPCRGKQGLFVPSEETLAECVGQIVKVCGGAPAGVFR